MTLIKTETVTVDERSDVLIELDAMSGDLDTLFEEIWELARSVAPISKQHRVTVERSGGCEDGSSGNRACDEATSERRGPEKVIPMLGLLRGRICHARQELEHMRHRLQIG